MRRIKGTAIRTGGLITIFSMIVTVVFIVIFVLLQSDYMVSNQTTNANIYLFTSEEADQLYDPSFTPQIDPSRVVTTNELLTDVRAYYVRQIVPFAILFCLFLMLLSMGLWLMLKKEQQKQTLRIAKSFAELEGDDLIKESPELYEAIQGIRQKYDDNLNDYKRLNSYLSHEQKNELAILRTNMELAENKVYVKNLDYLSASIDDILTLSETEGTSTKGEVDVSLVCAEVCDSYRSLKERIVFSFDESDDTTILAKQRWIYRAISNLVDNAVKYGGNKPIEVSVAAKKNSVVIKVKDHGIGIPKEKQEQIFNNRYRINELNKDGYGIGLSLVAHVCDLCGGFATLESEPGNGTVFYLSFPALAVR